MTGVPRGHRKGLCLHCSTAGLAGPQRPRAGARGLLVSPPSLQWLAQGFPVYFNPSLHFRWPWPSCDIHLQALPGLVPSTPPRETHPVQHPTSLSCLAQEARIWPDPFHTFLGTWVPRPLFPHLWRVAERLAASC